MLSPPAAAASADFLGRTRRSSYDARRGSGVARHPPLDVDRRLRDDVHVAARHHDRGCRAAEHPTSAQGRSDGPSVGRRRLSLSLAALILTAAALADRYGRRLLSMFGVVVFTSASLVCGLAWNITALDVARGVQGIGG